MPSPAHPCVQKSESPESNRSLKSNILHYLHSRHGPLLSFWTAGIGRSQARIEAHADIVYSLALIGELENVSQEAVTRFCDIASQTNLPGWKGINNNGGETLSVHNTAYLFGALNLLRPFSGNLYSRTLAGRQFDPGDILNLETFRPKFPPKWAHHSWRVSHWLGGVPSILLSLEQNAPQLLPEPKMAERCIDSVKNLLDQRTGLIRAYRSHLLQQAFRAAYKLRHAPDLGDIGGVAHILWINHVMGQPYVAAAAIRNEASRIFLANRPFMERDPYCLDFDVVQAFRTVTAQTSAPTTKEIERAKIMMSSIEKYFESPAPNYTLHKLPGALATYHECATLIGADTTPSVSVDRVDIIKLANWL